MRTLYTRYTLLLFILGINICAQNVEDQPLRLDSLLVVHKNMYFYQSPTIGHADSVFHRVEHIYLYFDTDSICRQFIRKGGFNAIPDEMDYLYYAVMTEMTPERTTLEIDKMEKVALEYKSQPLMREIEFRRAASLPDQTKEQFESRLNRLHELQGKAEERRDTLLQIRIMETILTQLRYGNRSSEMLEEAARITKILDQVTDKQYVARRHLYFFIGEIFYQYGDYEQAIPLLEKALKNAGHFFERSNLSARNDLGLYYRGQGNLDLSDSYFRSMLESPDQVKYRGEYDAIAICNLGKNNQIRKDYKKSKILLEKGLPVMIDFKDYSFIASVFISLGDCYLIEDNLLKTKFMIDSARQYINLYQIYNLNLELFPLMSRYYAATGDMELSMAYLDSTVAQNKEYQKQYNISHIFHVEKKLFEAEKQAKEEQLASEKLKKEAYRNLLLSLLILFLTAATFYVSYVRLRERKNHALYKRIMEENRMQVQLLETKRLLMQSQKDQLPDSTVLVQDNGMVYNNGNNIIQRLEELMQAGFLFSDSSLTRKTLAERLNTNENYLTTAIRNEYNGKTFSEYINSQRLMYSHQLLVNSPELSIKEITDKSGFSSYKYFHKLFREEFGMSPSEFRKMT